MARKKPRITVVRIVNGELDQVTAELDPQKDASRTAYHRRQQGKKKHGR